MMDQKINNRYRLMMALGLSASLFITPPVEANTALVDVALSSAAANNNHIEEREENTEQDQSSALQGYLKVGLGYKNEISAYDDEVEGLSLFVNGRYQWHGFFLESYFGANERDQGVSVGYNFYNTQHWSFDVNSVLAHGDINVDLYDNGKRLFQEFDSTTMLGLRATGQYGDTSVQFTAAPYSFNSDNDGYFASAWLGQAWYAKNWLIHTSVGLKYYSEDFLKYYYEISPTEATEHFSAYSPDAGFNIIGQVSASYPISENWLFETYYTYTDLSEEITGNPVMDFASGLKHRAENINEFGILVSYVF